MRLLLAGAVILSLGCSVGWAQTWHNSKIKSQRIEQRQLAIDDGVCTAVAARNIEIPAVTYHSDGTHSFTGWATVSNGSETSTITFNGFTRPSGLGAFANGVANGYSIGNAIRARRDRYKVYRACMLSLGWDEAEESQTYQVPATIR